MKVQVQYLRIIEISTVNFFILAFIKSLEIYYNIVGLNASFIINCAILLLIFLIYVIIIKPLINYKFKVIKNNLLNIYTFIDILEIIFMIIVAISVIFNDLLTITMSFLVAIFPIIFIRQCEFLSSNNHSKEALISENQTFFNNMSIIIFFGIVIGFILYLPVLNNYFLEFYMKISYLLVIIVLKVFITIISMKNIHVLKDSNSFEENKDKINFNILFYTFSIAIYIMLFESSNIMIDIIPIWLNTVIDNTILLLGLVIALFLIINSKKNRSHNQIFIFKYLGFILFLISAICISTISRNCDFSHLNNLILYFFKIVYLITFSIMLMPIPISKFYKSQKMVLYIFINFWNWVFSIAILMGGMLLLHSWSKEYNLYYFLVVLLIPFILGGIAGLKNIITRRTLV